MSDAAKKTPRITEVWITTKHNASTPEARAAITAALELHLSGFGTSGNRFKRRWYGRTAHGIEHKASKHSDLCVRFSKLEPTHLPEATRAALTAIRTVFADSSIKTRITPEEVMAMYGMARDEAGFFAAIMNGDSDGDCIVIDDATGKVIREYVIEFEGKP